MAQRPARRRRRRAAGRKTDLAGQARDRWRAQPDDRGLAGARGDVRRSWAGRL